MNEATNDGEVVLRELLPRLEERLARIATWSDPLHGVPAWLEQEQSREHAAAENSAASFDAARVPTPWPEAEPRTKLPPAARNNPALQGDDLELELEPKPSRPAPFRLGSRPRGSSLSAVVQEPSLSAARSSGAGGGAWGQPVEIPSPRPTLEVDQTISGPPALSRSNSTSHSGLTLSKQAAAPEPFRSPWRSREVSRSRAFALALASDAAAARIAPVALVGVHEPAAPPVAPRSAAVASTASALALAAPPALAVSDRSLLAPAIEAPSSRNSDLSASYFASHELEEALADLLERVALEAGVDLS